MMDYTDYFLTDYVFHKIKVLGKIMHIERPRKKVLTK